MITSPSRVRSAGDRRAREAAELHELPAVALVVRRGLMRTATPAQNPRCCLSLETASFQRLAFAAWFGHLRCLDHRRLLRHSRRRWRALALVCQETGIRPPRVHTCLRGFRQATDAARNPPRCLDRLTLPFIGFFYLLDVTVRDAGSQARTCWESTRGTMRRRYLQAVASYGATMRFPI